MDKKSCYLTSKKDFENELNMFIKKRNFEKIKRVFQSLDKEEKEKRKGEEMAILHH